MPYASVAELEPLPRLDAPVARHAPRPTEPQRYADAAPTFGVAGGLSLIEISAEFMPASPVVQRALNAANVVVYDRALNSLVAALLPLGAYAEPASPAVPADRPINERALG